MKHINSNTSSLLIANENSQLFSFCCYYRSIWRASMLLCVLYSVAPVWKCFRENHSRLIKGRTFDGWRCPTGRTFISSDLPVTASLPSELPERVTSANRLHWASRSTTWCSVHSAYTSWPRARGPGGHACACHRPSEKRSPQRNSLMIWENTLLGYKLNNSCLRCANCGDVASN